MKNKKTIIIAASLCIAAVLAAGISVTAYFTSLDTKENEIRVTNNKTEISEVFEPPESQTTGDNIFRKDVSVTNSGGSDCYVRVYADLSDSFVRSRAYFSDGTDPDDLTFYSAVRVTDDQDEITTFAEYVNGGEDWVFVPDDSDSLLAGYYYYKTPLRSGESTPPLFTYVRIYNPTEDEINEFEIPVYSESTQLTDSSGEYYADFEAAWTDFLSK